MAFPAQRQGLSWSTGRPPREADEAWLAPHVADRKTLLELGPGTGARAAALLRKLPHADYRAFEPSPALLERAKASVAVYAERASVEGRNLALPLPVKDATCDLAICLDLLEFLRMDELYMVLAEARRALAPGGICCLRVLSPAPGVRGSLAAFLHAKLPRFFAGAQPRELHHYLSPEDWTIVSEDRVPDGWLSRQTLVLERL